MSFLFGVIAASYDTTTPPPPPPPPPPPTCTPVCADPISSTSDGPYSDPAWSTCVDGVQTRTNSFVRSTTVTQTCTASDCSTFTTSNTTTKTIYVPQSQDCSATWYCSTTTFSGTSNFTSPSDVPNSVECVSNTVCSLSGYPGYSLIIC